MNTNLKKLHRFLTILAVGLFSTAGAHAANIDWLTAGSTGEFGTGGNWIGSVRPGPADLARITNNGTATITDGVTYEVSNLYVAGKNINNSTGTLQIVSGTLRVTGSFNTVANNPQIGTGSNALGRVEIAGGTLVRSSTNTANDSYLFVGGGGGKGFLTLSSGSVFIDFFRIGSDQSSTTGSGGVGQVDVSGGLMIITNQWLIGRDLETGILNITGGEVINEAKNYLATANDDFLTLAGSNTSTGIVNVVTGGLMRANGGIRIAQAAGVSEIADGTLRINGGRLVTQRLFQGASAGTSLAKVEFNGGILEATNATHVSGFMYGGLNVKVKSGGIIIDSANYNLLVTPAFLTDAGSPGGGVTKINTGTLRMTGANTYTGPTLVQVGGLVLSTASTGGGAITLNDGSDFGAIVSAAGSSLAVSSLTLNAGAGTNALTFELGVFGNPTAPVVVATSFSVSRTNKVNITGAGLSMGEFTLVQFTSGSGVTQEQFELNSLPSGVLGNLVFESNAIKLNITEAPSLHWNGNLSSNWDTNTANWLDFATNPPTAKVYSDGSAVQFDDATTNFLVTLSTALLPAAVTVTNAASNYVFSGSGVIAGATTLRKQGNGVLTLGTTNTYSGDTTISAGTLRLGIGEVIPHGAAKGNLSLNGTLDLNGFNEGVNGLTGAGVIDNTAATPSTITVGNQGVPSSFSGTITNSGAGSLALNKNGNNVLLLSGTNGHSGGTRINTGTILAANNFALGTGTLTLNAGTIGSDGTTARSFSNPILVLAGSTFGSSINNGLLSFSGLMDLSGTNRSLTFNSDVLLSGGSTNGAINKLGSGTLTLQGAHNWNDEAEVRNGTLILDNAFVTNTAAFRPDGDIPFGLARIVIGPGSVWVQRAGGGNFRVGSDGNVTATNIADIAGTVRFENYNSTSAKIVIGQGSTTGFLNLLTNGRAVVRSVQKSGSGNYAEFNFNGGTLEALADNTDFMQGLSAVYVRAGGGSIDTAGFNISIVQDLLDGGGNGGLTKTGAGSLRFNGINTFTGTTTVNAGSIGGAGTIAGPVIIASGGSLTPGNDNVIAITINNTLTLQGTTVMDIVPEGGPASDLVQGVTTLTYGGTLVLTNVGAATPTSGQVFNLFDAASFSGSFAAFDLPALSGGLSWNTNNLALDGTISVIGTAAPQFNSPMLSGNNLTLSGSGGTPNGTYYVLTSTNIETPLTNWTAIATNQFDGSGNFNFVEIISPGTPRQFYLISTP